MHDREYAIGGTERERWRVEKEFFFRMLEEARASQRIAPWFMVFVNVALTFTFGWLSWNYKGARPQEHANDEV